VTWCRRDREGRRVSAARTTLFLVVRYRSKRSSVDNGVGLDPFFGSNSPCAVRTVGCASRAYLRRSVQISMEHRSDLLDLPCEEYVVHCSNAKSIGHPYSIHFRTRTFVAQCNRDIVTSADLLNLAKVRIEYAGDVV